jgi:hypothetical protein
MSTYYLIEVSNRLDNYEAEKINDENGVFRHFSPRLATPVK